MLLVLLAAPQMAQRVGRRLQRRRPARAAAMVSTRPSGRRFRGCRGVRPRAAAGMPDLLAHRQQSNRTAVGPACGGHGRARRVSAGAPGRPTEDAQRCGSVAS